MRGRIIALTAVCLLVFAGVAGAAVYFSATLTPTSVNEGANKLFRLTITNDLSSTESIKKVNITFPNYIMTNVLDPMSGWTHVNGSDWIVWSGDLSAGGSQIFQFYATAPLGIGSDANSTVIVNVYNSTDNLVNSTTNIITTNDDTTPPTAELVSPPDSISNTNGVTFTCNASDNGALKKVEFYWNHSGSWAENGTKPLAGSGCPAFIETQFVQSGLNDGNYVWGCRACDTANNCAFSAANRTITIDTHPPSVTLHSPLSQAYATSTVEINYSASDTNLDSCWYELDGANSTPVSAPCQNWTLNSVPDGQHALVVWANDSATNQNSAYVSFSVDTTPPQIEFILSTLQDNSMTNVNLTMNVSHTEAHPDTLAAYLNGTMVHSQAYSGSFTTVISPVVLPEGMYTYYIWVNDTVGNSNQTGTRTVTVDTTDPVIGFISPTPDNLTYLPVDYFDVNVSHTELHPDSIALFMNGVQPGPSTGYSDPYTNGTITSMPDGTHAYYVWLNDTAGNSAQTGTRTITIDTAIPLVSFIADTPANDARVSTTGSMSINVSHTELNPDSVILEVNGANETLSYMTENFTAITRSWGAGAYNYTVYVNDSAGNVNSTEMRNVTFYVPPPPAPPSPGSYVPSRSGGYSPPVCKENWECTEWTTECVNFEYTRTCTDLNSCGTENYKPAEEIACTLAAEDTEPAERGAICTPGEMKCSGSNIVECDDDGSAWRLVMACEHGCEDAVCKDEMAVSPSGGETGLTGFFVGQGANLLAVGAGAFVIIGGAYYYFRIRRFRVL